VQALCSSAASRGALVVLALASTVALADQAPVPEAARLFEEGRSLLKEGKLDDACDRFARSWQLERAIGTQLNHADCLERRNELVQAWELFDDASRAATSRRQDSRAKYARERADGIAKKLAIVDVRLAGSLEGMVVTIGGTTVKTAAVMSRYTLPGSVEVTATDARKRRFSATVDAVIGQRVAIDVPAFDAPAPRTHTSARRQRLYIAAAIGIGGLVATAATFRFYYEYRDLSDGVFDTGRCTGMPGENVVCMTQADLNTYRSSRFYRDISIGFGVASAGLLIGAGIVYLTAPANVVVTPTVSQGAVGLGVAGRF
jgi:hypothetical protein